MIISEGSNRDVLYFESKYYGMLMTENTKHNILYDISQLNTELYMMPKICNKNSHYKLRKIEIEEIKTFLHNLIHQIENTHLDRKYYQL